MTDNPLLQPGADVWTSDGRKVVILYHRCTEQDIFADVPYKANDGWVVCCFNSSGVLNADFYLVIRPPVHPNLRGTRTFCARTGNPFDPYLSITITNGDASTAKVEVLPPEPKP